MFLVVAVKANDTIIVHKDPRLDTLTRKQVQINKRLSIMTANGLYKGFRLQVMSTTSRTDAFKAKTDMLSNFPDQKSYILFQSPYFKVRTGNFIKREDAEKFRKQLNKLFPSGVYIVEDAIEYNPKEDDELFN